MKISEHKTQAAQSAASDITAISWLPNWFLARFLPYALLARWDRPIGTWLLLLPGLWGLVLATPSYDGWFALAALAFAVGAFALRGAGCTINDILDRDLDAKVARTAQRPLASGMIGLRAAWLWLAAQLFVGLLILLCLPPAAQIASLCALPLIVLYPLMKRFTWWPQAWLGVTFNWAFWIGIALYQNPFQPGYFALFIGAIFWTIAYDTIYAAQDRTDDALVGVKSTARLFGAHIKLYVCLFYAAALLLWLAGGWLLGLSVYYSAGWLLAAFITVYLLKNWRVADDMSSRRGFLQSRFVGMAMLLAFAVGAISAGTVS